ncbi:MAG: chromosome segregation protein, partial [Acidobacteriota bacterium]
ATQAREAVHAHELEINRRQQQIALDTQQAEMLLKRAEELEAERQQLEARREPERMALEGRRQAAVEAASAREEAAALAAAAAEEYTRSWMAIEALEQDVEKARSDVYAILNTITALTAAHDSAAAQRERAVDAQSRLELEARELGAELERARAQRMSAAEALHRAQESLDSARMAKAARESELSSARVEHEWRSREVRTREQDLAGMSARLRSLEEIDTHRSGFADAARMVLVNANGKVGQMGAVADFIEVEPRYERAVEACLGDLLQHILVERLEHVSAGLKLIRQEDAGRCGFIVGRPDGSVTVVSHPEPAALPAPPLQADVQETSSFFRSMFGGGSPAPAPVPVSVPVPVTMTSDSGTGTQEYSAPSGSVMLSSVVKIGGPFPQAITSVMGGALIADSFEAASRIAPTVDFPVVTLEGDVFRGRHVVTGGDKAESRGILATKREIKELREKIAESRSELERLIGETAGFEQAMAHATAAIAGLNDEIHRQEKSIVGVQAQAERATDDESRVQQRADLVQSEINRAKEEIAGLDARQDEARESINRLNEEKGESELTLAETQRRLGDARDTAEALSAKAAEARAQHAALVERSSAAVAEVARLEELAADLERRVESATRDMALMREQRERLLNAIVDGQRLMDEDVAKLEGLRQEMIVADELAVTIKLQSENQEAVIRDARRAVDALRALAAEVDVQRATAESDLTHLAQQAIDSVNASLDEIRDEVTAMEAAGQVQPDVRAIRAAEAVDPDEIEDGIAPEEGLELAQPVESTEPPAMTAEEAIAELREKIERMGPVNMMAIEQSKELEERHLFLTTQQKDLVDSIAQTNEAISKIDETTHARFKEAFTAINENFQGMFTTLFGGGKAGILLLDENDPLESGIDIVAQPPGKRLQSVMLLSGGEKALTAIALMFGMFKYRPSPFCLLDEIDAPLDDANIGRFVEMLRSMMDKTQFIVITHSRKTMEIADKLYGVTMEEPGVSKLISIQMN